MNKDQTDKGSSYKLITLDAELNFVGSSTVSYVKELSEDNLYVYLPYRDAWGMTAWTSFKVAKREEGVYYYSHNCASLQKTFVAPKDRFEYIVIRENLDVSTVLNDYTIFWKKERTEKVERKCAIISETIDALNLELTELKNSELKSLPEDTSIVPTSNKIHLTLMKSDYDALKKFLIKEASDDYDDFINFGNVACRERSKFLFDLVTKLG